MLPPTTSNVATQHTLKFVREYFPNEGAKILEVGCGKGQLAAELQKAGYLVTGLDTSTKNIECAKALGVNAQLGDILEFHCEESFDAILFTRSLHHITSLDTLLNRVKKLLNEKGRILIEDFGMEQMDLKTATWFYELRELMYTVAGTRTEMDGSNQNDGPLERWKKEHCHEPALHPRKEIVRVMERNFGNIHSSTTPYLYRYFIPGSEAIPNANEVLSKIFDWEAKAIEKGLLEPIGFRIAAKKYFCYL